jgi:ribosome biogenesis protein Nip4
MEAQQKREVRSHAAISVYIGSDQGLCGGASKNRTCDLSVISSSQGYDLADIGRYATF